MTYADLIEQTRQKKQSALREITQALKSPTGFLVKAEIKKNPGAIAWSYLAREFCESLAEHIDEFLDAPGMDDSLAREIQEIYMAYEDGDEDLYQLLPIEAQLFTV